MYYLYERCVVIVDSKDVGLKLLIMGFELSDLLIWIILANLGASGNVQLVFMIVLNVRFHPGTELSLGLFKLKTSCSDVWCVVSVGPAVTSWLVHWSLHAHNAQLNEKWNSNAQTLYSKTHTIIFSLYQNLEVVDSGTDW